MQKTEDDVKMLVERDLKMSCCWLEKGRKGERGHELKNTALEKGKETNSSLDPPERAWLC